jgi:hypothetical protein
MNDVTFTSYDYPIGGKMVVGSCTMTVEAVDDLLSLVDGKDEIKRRLLTQMLEYMLENRLIEFTRTEDIARHTQTFRVRAYLAPNDQVKILRTAYKID